MEQKKKTNERTNERFKRKKKTKQNKKTWLLRKVTNLPLDVRALTGAGMHRKYACVLPARFARAAERKLFLRIADTALAPGLEGYDQGDERQDDKGQVTRGNFSCNLQRNKRCVASCKNNFTCNTHFATAIVALRVARKVERPSTFRNVARQVACV